MSLLFRYVKPTDQEITNNEKRACYSHFSRGEGIPCWSGPRGRTRVEQEVERARERWPGAFTVVSMGKARQGVEAGLRVASLNSISEL